MFLTEGPSVRAVKGVLWRHSSRSMSLPSRGLLLDNILFFKTVYHEIISLNESGS